jgi:hypothetical protein
LKKHWTRYAASLLAVAGGLALFAAGTRAQQPYVLKGRVTDENGQAVPSINVLLHRVTPEGGALVADTSTRPDGRFELRGTAADGTVLFAAARYRDELYIGPMLRTPFDQNQEYTLRVGTPGTSVSALAEQMGGAELPPGSAAGTSRRWLLILAPLIALLGLAVYAALRVRGPDERRRLITAVARLDNEREHGSSPLDKEQYREKRRELLERIQAIRES